MHAWATLTVAANACALMVWCCSLCSAQTLTTARITGTVRDATGAVVTQAEVVVHSGDTGERRTAITDESGDYAFPLLPPGTYQISISAHGFSTALYNGVQVRTGTSATIIGTSRPVAI